MSTTVRRSMLALVVIALLAVALPSLAQDTLATDEPATETETTTAPTGDVPTPAIEIPQEAPADEDAEWSYRFLVPATLVLGTLAVVGTIFMYFVRVTRNRYRVVE